MGGDVFTFVSAHTAVFCSFSPVISAGGKIYPFFSNPTLT